MHIKFWLETLKRKEQLDRTRRRWNDNVKTNMKEIVCQDVDSIYLAQGKDQWQAVV